MSSEAAEPGYENLRHATEVVDDQVADQENEYAALQESEDEYSDIPGLMSASEESESEYDSDNEYYEYNGQEEDSESEEEAKHQDVSRVTLNPHVPETVMNDVYHDYTVDSEAEEEKENEELQAAAQRIIEETETAKETAEGKIAEETVQLRRSSRNKERVDYSELNQRGVRVVGAIRPVPSIVKKPEAKKNCH